MGSIAYVVDKNMIEFHRLNGHETMNFWRLKTSKKFQDFHTGDLLFFLAKRKQKNQEKGLLGYGRLASNSDMTLNKMWNTYDKLNGYETKEDFISAISKITKDKVVPKELNSLYLEDVVFFQTPVFLSEFGIMLSKNLESYLYLDKNDQHTTTRILQKAKQDGMDVWSAIIHNRQDSESIFELIEIRNALNKAQSEVCDINYSENDYTKARRLLKRYLDDKHEFEYLQNTLLTAFKYQDGILSILQPSLSDVSKDNNKKLLYGQIAMYKRAIEVYYPYQIKIEYLLLNKNSEIEKY